MTTSVLIVEDESVLARNLAATLARAGHDADCAGSLDEARSCLAERCYDAVCLDLSLPDGNGFDLIDAIRACCGDVPIVVVTGQDTVANRKTGTTEGVADLVAKPFGLADMAARLGTLIAKGGAPFITEGIDR